MRISDWSSDVCSSDLRNGYATVTYTAGYAPEEVPVALVQAMLLLIGHSFSNREAVSVGNTGREIPLGVESLCIRHRPVLCNPALAIARSASSGSRQIGQAAWRERVGQYG